MYNYETRKSYTKSILDSWKEAYNSKTYPKPTKEEQFYITMLQKLVPSILPFHLRLVDTLPNATGTYTYQTCEINIARGEGKNIVYSTLFNIDTAIHELCHHIDYYHQKINPMFRNHSKQFYAAIDVLMVKKHLIYSDFNPKDFPSLKDLKETFSKNLTKKQLYSLYEYSRLNEKYSKRYNDWNIDTLCNLFGVDLKQGKLLDR